MTSSSLKKTSNGSVYALGFEKFARKNTRTSFASLFLVFTFLGVITMQSAHADENKNYLENEKLSRSFSGARNVFDLAWSPDQTKIAVRGIGKVYLWDLSSDEEVWSAKGPNEVNRGIAISPDSQYVMLPANGDAEVGQTEDSVRQSVLSLLPVADPSSPKYVKDIGAGKGVARASDFALAQDGSVIAAVLGIDSGYVSLYDPKSWKVAKRIGQFKNPRGIVVNPQMAVIDANRKIVVGGYVSGDVQVWNYESNEKVAQFQASRTGLKSLALNPANGEIITGGDGSQIGVKWNDDQIVGGVQDSANELVKAWDSNTGKLLRTYPGAKYGISSISVSRDGRYIAATEGGSKVGVRVDLWDASTRKLLKTIEYTSHNGRNPVAFSPDGRQLAIGNDDEVKIFDLD